MIEIVEGPDGKWYAIPRHQMDDWDAWLLLHQGEMAHPWTRPNYAIEVEV